MDSKKKKREVKKTERRQIERAASIRRRRIKKAEYCLATGARKEFKKGGSVHDVFFHLMMRDVAFAARFLNSYLPKKLRDALDWSDLSKIKVLSTDFYDRRMKKHIADLIFVVPCKEGDEFVVLTLIVEHKAQSGKAIDRKTIKQLVKYVVLEVETQLQNASIDEIVYQPIVVLFYTGSDSNFEVPSWEKTFPIPKILQVAEFKGTQITFEPICVNLTRLFLEDKLSGRDFERVMVEAMARASLKRLPESYSTLFRSLGKIKDWTPENLERLNACVNYVALTAEEPITEKEYDLLAQSVNNEEAENKMKTIFDLAEDKGRIEGMRVGMRKGKVAGEIKAIKTVVSLRFQETSRRFNNLLAKLDDLKLLDQTYKFALTAVSLPEVENFVENLTKIKPKVKRGVRKTTSRGRGKSEGDA